MRKPFSCLALYFLLSFVAGNATSSSAATYYANPDPGVSACACNDPGAFCGSTSTCGVSLPYRCLADAVRRTCPGDTVIARNGTYPECFYINNGGSSDASRVEIKAEFNGQAIISRPATCSGQGETIVFAASYVTLRGFKMTAAPSSPSGGAITVTGGPSNEINQCEIYGNQGGLTFYGAGNRLIDTLVHDNTGSGITLAAPNTTITGGQSTNNGGGVSLTGAGSVLADYTTITGLVVRNNQSIGIDLGTSFNTLTNVVVNDSGLTGIYVRPGANNNTVTGGEVANDALGILVYNGTPQATDNTFTGIDIHGHTVDGISLDGGVHTTIDRCHVHHNYYNGIIDGHGALHTVIQYSEIDHNSSGQGSHGLYLGGQSGTIRGNAVHHNEAWGIHLWAAPQGTPTDHYIVENNDVYANQAGIVLGGSNYPPTDPLFCREMPQYTEVRYNLVHHNYTTGMNYLLTTCDAPTNCTGTDIGNSFHHNTVYANGGLMMQASFVKDDRLLVKNNLLVGTSASPTLVWVTNSSMFSNDFDGNIAFKLGGSSSDPIFDWNSLPYSFDQIHASGIRQKTTCAAATGSDPLNPMETHSMWGDQAKIVDPNTTTWSAPYKRICPAGGLCAHDREGDFHLRVGSSGITGGVCCPGSNGGQDIDDEAPAAACAPADCSSAGDGIGADFHLDSDADGVADLSDCQPFNASDAGICDLDPFEPSTQESMCSANPGAGYDPAVYPAAVEICDGKDNDCAGGAEADADLDGFFAGCVGTPRYDCNDGNASVHAGAVESISNLATCFDGIDNDCDGVIDLDCATDVYPGGRTIITGNLTCGSDADAAAASVNNTYECFQEAGASSARQLHVLWTFSTSGVPTGINYDLRLEGFRNSGANDTFNFSSWARATTSACVFGEGGTSTLIGVTDTSDTNQLKVASVGLSQGTYCVKAVGSKEASDTSQDTLTLDRLFLFPSPVAMNDFAGNPPTVGTVIAGKYFFTQRSDDVPESIREEQSGGAYRLWHTWQFSGLPTGSGHKLHFEGYRVLASGTKADDFNFYYSTDPNSWSPTNPTTGFTQITGSTINVGADPTGGTDSSSFGGSGLSGTVYIRVIDAQKSQTGGSQSILHLDHLAIKTLP